MPIYEKNDSTKPITAEKLGSLPTGMKHAETPEGFNAPDQGIRQAPLPEMLSITQAVERTNLSYEYLRHLCASGKIVTVKAGKKYLINSFSLAEFLNKGEQ